MGRVKEQIINEHEWNLDALYDAEYQEWVEQQRP